MKTDLEFLLFRLNLVDDSPSLFPAPTIRSDADIIRVIGRSTAPQFDRDQVTGISNYRWSVRDYVEFEGVSPGAQLLSVTLSRSTVSAAGAVVTDAGLEPGISEAHPPLAVSSHIFVYLDRHLVAIEYNSLLMRTTAWVKQLEEILDDARRSLELGTALRLEPVPRDEEIMRAFRSFDQLTRLRVHLRLPNPDVTPYIKDLYNELQEGGIREYVQDMRNPAGLNKEPKKLPHASAAMAQAGYKDGDVVMEGRRQGRFERVTTGRRAARGNVQQLKSFVRGMRSTAKTQETRMAVDSIIKEIERMQPPPVLTEGNEQ